MAKKKGKPASDQFFGCVLQDCLILVYYLQERTPHTRVRHLLEVEPEDNSEGENAGELRD